MSISKRRSAEEKIALVRRCLKGELGIREAGRLAGVASSTIAKWLIRYKAEGVDAFLPREKNRVYSPDWKAAAVCAYLNGEGSYVEIMGKYKLRSASQLETWIKVYTAHGDLNSVKQSGGGSYMKQGRETTQEERIQIAKNCIASGRNYGEMALKYQVSYQQARTWTLRFERLGAAGLEDRRGKRKKDQTPRTELELAQVEIEKLKHENYMLTMERDLLKKLDEVERRDASHK